MSRNVETHGYFILPGRPAIYSPDGERIIEPAVPHRTLNPGSVVTLEDDMAKDFVKRGKGVFTNKHPFEAPPPAEDEKPERADLGNKLARAERMATAGAR